VRQIIGWREYVRIIYLKVGTKQRTENYWKFKDSIPTAYWTAETGIDPIDLAIKNVLNTGYSHHIERLMILGNFMLLSEYHPDYVYEWFMEMYIDAYDWVMVPNVYGMSQYADGGIITTKPYISSSNYVKKMSNYKAGPWCEIWDSLFWRFIGKRYDFFKSNPRLSMMAVQYDKMDKQKKERLLRLADNYTSKLNE
jgi:deoxyribodipyrimidine photolyase-related protein